MKLNGNTHGIYITTSTYTRGATTTAEKYETLGYKLDLVDSERLLEAIHSTTRPTYTSLEDADAPFFDLYQHPDKIPFLGDAVYCHGIAMKSCRSGFEQHIPEVQTHNLVRKTAERATIVQLETFSAQGLLTAQGLKLLKLLKDMHKP